MIDGAADAASIEAVVGGLEAPKKLLKLLLTCIIGLAVTTQSADPTYELLPAPVEAMRLVEFPGPWLARVLQTALMDCWQYDSLGDPQHTPPPWL